jgi:quercetin dioxygenase-like cupin family protein
MMRYPMAARIGVAIAVSSIFVGSTLAQDSKPGGEAHVVKSPADVQWGDGPPSLPKGLKAAVLHGDPGKPEPYALLLKMPAGYKVPAHWHSQDENVTVISGTFYAGMGDKLDAGKAMGLKPGAYVFMPAKMHHYAFAKTPTVIELHGSGPFDITYIDPADDPQKKK